MEAWNDLLQRGMTGGSILVDWEQCAFYAEEDGQVVGVLTYKVYDHDHSLYIAVGYVKPEYRKQGVYRSLWDAAVEKAREKSCTHVTGVTHWDNAEMQAVMKHMGREPRYITYEYDLPPVED